MPLNTRRVGSIAYCLCIAFITYTSLQYYPRWEKKHTESTLSWDVSGYYWYLPSLFIYHDLRGQSFKDDILNKYQPTGNGFQQGYIDSATGHWVMKYSSGTAVAMIPAFSIAHAIAHEKDGFSRPYQLAIQLEWLLIAFLGLWLLQRFLRNYYSDGVVGVTLLFLVFGTNYLNWAAIDVGQTHSLLFTLYAALLLQTRAFYIRPTRVRGFFIGLTIGYMMLIRPTELLAAIIPIAWGLEGINIINIRARLTFIWQHGMAFFLAITGGLLGVLPQLIYWKWATGHWLEYSYQDQGFNFLHPHFKQYTFDWAHGWLIHSPGMLLAIIGIIPFFLRGKNRVALLAFALLNYYVVASWNVWSYGSRAMIQSYPVLCVFIASLVQWAAKSRFKTVVMAAIILPFVYYNMWWTYASHPGELYPGAAAQSIGALEGDEMHGRYYIKVAGRFGKVPELWHRLNDLPFIFEGTPKDLKVIQQLDTVLSVDSAHTKSEEIKFALGSDNMHWLRISAHYTSPRREDNHWLMRKIFVRQYKAGQQISSQEFRVDRIFGDKPVKYDNVDIFLSQPLPDTIGFFLLNPGSNAPLRMDSIQVAGFNGN